MMTIREPNSRHATLDETKAVVPLLRRAVRMVFRNDTKRIGERQLRRRKRNSMLFRFSRSFARSHSNRALAIVVWLA